MMTGGGDQGGAHCINLCINSGYIQNKEGVMAADSSNYHEPVELLSEETKDMHRALVTVMEELEAIDWYQQRAEACADASLQKILLHNKNEEVEHAMMSLEWIRRNSQQFDEMARTYLFTEGPITEIEKKAVQQGDAGGGGQVAGQTSGQAAGRAFSSGGMSLGIGSLKGRG